MKLTDIISAFELIAPTRYAESWDNVGLLAGDPQQEVAHAMIAIDYTPDVAREAADARCELIVAYHPPIFEAVKRINAGSLVFDAIRRGVAIYSPHTAWDVAPGGTNDFLADVLELRDRTALRTAAAKANEYKLVTFVPGGRVDAVSAAIFAAGAGRIGNYSSCSFQSAGTGTFFGEAGAQPSVGSPQKLERVDEVRLETIVPIREIDRVVAALRQSHPYEEPAFDLIQLAPRPDGLGQGRFGTMAPTPRSTLFYKIKSALGIERLLIAGPTEGDVISAACGAGACGDMLGDAIAKKAGLYLTGEMRHHDALKATNAGMTVVCTLHSNSERASLRRLRDRLAQALPGVTFHLSQQDRDPFSIH